MFKPIKRIFIPKHLALQPMGPKAEPTPAPVPAPAPAATPAKPQARFDELPQPDMVEKNSDSVWAAFESVHPLEIDRE